MSHNSTPDQSGEQRAAAMLTGNFLIRAYQQTEGEPGYREADSLAAGIWRRNLNR